VDTFAEEEEVESGIFSHFFIFVGARPGILFPSPTKNQIDVRTIRGFFAHL